MRKSNYKQLIIISTLFLFLNQAQAQDSERDPERFLRGCDCNRMEEYIREVAEEKYECKGDIGGAEEGNYLCTARITDMDCTTKIEIFYLETHENVIKLLSYPDDHRRNEFLNDGGFDSVSGICSRSNVTEEQKEYCVNNDEWKICCLGGLTYFCDEEKADVGTDPIHIFLHGLCGVLWVSFIGYAVLSGWRFQKLRRRKPQETLLMLSEL